MSKMHRSAGKDGKVKWRKCVAKSQESCRVAMDNPGTLHASNMEEAKKNR